MKCGYASGWQGWIQRKTLAPGTVCRLPAKTTALTHGRGAGVQQAGAGETHRHAREMNKKGDFSYVGRKDESTESSITVIAR